jgi:hypothetical protein
VPIELPSITGQVTYDVERLLREIVLHVNRLAAQRVVPEVVPSLRGIDEQLDGILDRLDQLERRIRLLAGEVTSDAGSFDPSPGTPTPSPATCEGASTAPNRLDIVQAVYDQGGWDFSSHEGQCRFTNAVVYALFQADARFGHLRKTAGQTHCVDPDGRLVAEDATLFKTDLFPPCGQVVDFLIGAGGPNPQPAWQPLPITQHAEDDWIEPVPNP